MIEFVPYRGNDVWYTVWYLHNVSRNNLSGKADSRICTYGVIFPSSPLAIGCYWKLRSRILAVFVL